MDTVRLTRRGKIVVALLVTIAGYLVASAAISAVTPDECKVPTEQMSQGCIALIYK